MLFPILPLNMALLTQLLLLSIAAALISAQRITAIFPRFIPVNTPLASLQLFVSPAVTPINLVVSSTTGLPQYIPAIIGADGYTSVPLPAINVTGPLSINVQGTVDAHAVVVTVYDVPIFTGTSDVTLTSAGLTSVELLVNTSVHTVPVGEVRVLIDCWSYSTHTAPAVIVQPARLTPTGGVFWAPSTSHAYIYTTPATLAPAGNKLTFVTEGVPNTCKNVSFFVSYGDSNLFHYTGEATSKSISAFQRVKIVSLYPFTIRSSPWVATHNLARITISSQFQAAVDAAEYYEEAWRQPSLPSGRLVDPTYFAIARNKSAKLIIVAGTQFNATAVDFAMRNPGINVLVLSTLRQSLPLIPNLSFATGRMYEALYLAGFVAASASKSGKIGFIMSLDAPGSYGYVNAFFLGAQAAHARGLAVKPEVLAWIIGAFSDDWAEKHAAIDLLDRGVDVLMPVTDNSSPQLECHARNCFSMGFNFDERQILGDKVLMSVLFQLTPIYMEFVRRIVANEPFGPDNYLGGLSRGVDISSMSQYVPLAAQQELTRIAAFIRESPDAQEKVFCTTGSLIDASGSTRFNGSAPPPDATLGGLTLTPIPCMPTATIHSMKWVLEGISLLGRFVPPPRPAPQLRPPPNAVLAANYFLGVTLALLTLVAVAGIIVFAKTDPIRYASPVFLQILNVGALTMAAVLFWDVAATPSVGKCVGKMWVSGLAFALLMGSLFCKTYRVHKLFNNKKLRRLRMTANHVLRLVAFVFFCEAAILLILTFVFPRTLVRVDNGPDAYSDICAAGKGPFNVVVDGYVVLNVVHFVLLLWGSYLAFQTRNVPLGFNESRYVGITIYNFFLCQIVALIMGGAVSTTPDMEYFADAVRLGVAPIFTLFFLYGPKFHAVAQGLVDSYRGDDGWYILSNKRTDKSSVSPQSGNTPKHSSNQVRVAPEPGSLSQAGRRLPGAIVPTVPGTMEVVTAYESAMVRSMDACEVGSMGDLTPIAERPDDDGDVDHDLERKVSRSIGTEADKLSSGGSNGNSSSHSSTVADEKSGKPSFWASFLPRGKPSHPSRDSSPGAQPKIGQLAAGSASSTLIGSEIDGPPSSSSAVSPGGRFHCVPPAIGKVTEEGDEADDETPPPAKQP